MKRSLIVLAGTALLSVAAADASAACREEIARLSPGTTTGPASGTADAASGQRIAKDGSNAPLQSGAAGSSGSGPATTGSTAQGQVAGQGGIATCHVDHRFLVWSAHADEWLQDWLLPALRHRGGFLAGKAVA